MVADEYRNVDGFEWWRYGDCWELDLVVQGVAVDVFVRFLPDGVYVRCGDDVYRLDADGDIDDVLRDVSLWAIG